MKYIKSFLKNKLIPGKGIDEPLSLKEKYDLVLHIGAPKSGTSALQNFFLKNRYVLQNKEMAYPKHGMDPNGISGGHSKLAIALIENRTDDAKVLFSSWYNNAKSKNRLLLLSSESFFNLAQKMAPLLSGKRVLVIAYHRDIVEYCISVHNQVIKRHFGTLNFTQYAQSILRKQNSAGNLINKSFLKIYQEWENLVGRENLIVRPYGKDHFTEGRIEKDFIDQLGMKFDGFVLKDKKINPSYTEDALELKRMINYVLDRESPHNHTIDVCLQEYSEMNSGVSSGKYKNGLDDELYMQLKSFFAEEEKKISDTFLNGIDITDKKKILVFDKNNVADREHISLQKAFDYLQKNEKIREYLYHCTVKKLEHGYSNYALYKLAELLKIPHIENYETIDHWFKQPQLNRMSSGKYKEADILRDIAILLERRGDVENAYRIIKRVSRLRPKGKNIADLKASLKTQLKSQ
ncbi:hypothetical protein YH65_00925 [Sulfurovum lithotrophicum]|uniref:Sulfotransferase domain-containing protein n=1 Tax=Sulfurovum lithotrophicum TaxID=206403 RepID=A0A7U4LZL7_9BACT|nr:hypothetical protein [Sulfurovum lithotrophicum]AKF24125.1 hypothetical protein YH65_00925 [Sulfurovum lithotrophicum]